MYTRHLPERTKARASFTLRPGPYDDSPKTELENYRRNSFVKDPEKAFLEHTETLETCLSDYRRYDAILREYEALAVSEACNAKLKKVFAEMGEDMRKSLYPKDTSKWQSWQSVEQLEQYIADRKAVLT